MPRSRTRPAPWRDPLWGVANAKSRRRGRRVQEADRLAKAARSIQASLASFRHHAAAGTAPTGARLLLLRAWNTIRWKLWLWLR